MKFRLNNVSLFIAVLGSLLALTGCAKPDVAPTIPNGTPNQVNPVASPTALAPDLYLERFGNRF